MKLKNFALYVLAFVLTLLVVGLALALSPAHAAPLPTTFASPIIPPVDLGSITSWLAALGILPLVPIAVELLKRVGVIRDGMAAVWSTAFSVALFFLLFILGVFGIDVSGDAAQDAYGILIQLGTLVLMIFGSPAMYKLARALGIAKPLTDRV